MSCSRSPGVGACSQGGAVVPAWGDACSGGCPPGSGGCRGITFDPPITLKAVPSMRLMAILINIHNSLI